MSIGACSEYYAVFILLHRFASKFVGLVDTNALALGLEIIEMGLTSSFFMFSNLDTELDQDVPLIWKLEFVSSPPFIILEGMIMFTIL